MRKSNWIILAVIVAASAFFLWLWYYLRLNLVHNPFDLIVSILWWVLVAGICYGIHRAELRRQERVRTCYIGPAALYNSEAGEVALEADQTRVEQLQKTLAGLDYNFDIADVSDELKEKFAYMVRSKKFKLEDKSKPEGDVKDWEGEVVAVSDPDEPQEFKGRDELERLLTYGPIPDPNEQEVEEPQAQAA